MDYESLLAKAEQECEPVFARFARIERENFARVLQAFTEENVGTQHFAPTTGYGYDDVGRQTLERFLKDLQHIVGEVYLLADLPMPGAAAAESAENAE